mgnify:FL=1
MTCLCKRIRQLPHDRVTSININFINNMGVNYYLSAYGEEAENWFREVERRLEVYYTKIEVAFPHIVWVDSREEST